MRKHTAEEIETRRASVIAAAAKVFLRYGYARTTLGDIATAAKISRPALYQLYAGKDEIFDAVLQDLVRSEIESYRAELSRFRNVRTRLLHCVERWSMGGYRLTSAHPDARDAFDMAYPAVQRMYDVLAKFYAELLSEAVDASSINMSAEHLARLLIFSLRGIKDLANDAETLQRMLAQEVDIFLGAIAAQTK